MAKNQWRPIKTYRGPDYRKVDIWVEWGASPMTMGWGDAFRVIDAYRKNNKWFHLNEMNGGKEDEIVREYVTYWMPIPKAPK